eukprot:56394_1
MGCLQSSTQTRESVELHANIPTKDNYNNTNNDEHILRKDYKEEIIDLEQPIHKKPPTTINELKSRMRAMGVSDNNIEKFHDQIDDGYYDIESIKEDISDREQSILFDLFRDKLKDEKTFDIVKAIMDNTKTVDYLLGKYYEACGINNYYD